MGELIQFPRPPLPAEKGLLMTGDENRLLVRCEDLIHVYAEVPGRCQCGANYWDGEVGGTSGNASAITRAKEDV